MDDTTIGGPPKVGPEAQATVLRRINLAERASDYGPRRHRPAADPIGLAGLPDTRAGLDGLLTDLCARLQVAEGRPVRGTRIAADLELQDTRSLRLLCAYGHVHHRIRQIVGIAGQGYSWGDGAAAEPGIYMRAAGQARQMGRCHFFLAAVYGKDRSQVELAQLCLDLVHPAPSDRCDELAGMLAADGVGTEELLDAMLTLVKGRQDGKEVLGRLGERHRDVLISASVLGEIRLHLAAAERALATAG